MLEVYILVEVFFRVIKMLHTGGYAKGVICTEFDVGSVGTVTLVTFV